MNRTQRATLAVLSVAVGAFSLIQSLLIPDLGPLARELGTDQSTITWLLTAYLISASVSTPIAGRLGDVWGKDRVLVISLALLAAGSLVGALAPDVGWMIAARALQGIGGGVLPLSFGIIRDELPPERVPQAISVTASLLTVGIVGGIVLAGPLVSALGHSWLFWAPFVVCMAAAAAAARVVPRSPTRTGERIRPWPALLLAGWLVLLLVPVSRASVWGWASPAVLLPLAGSAAVFGLWVRSELRADVPLVDLRALRSRSVWTAHAIAFLIGFGLYSSSTLIPQFLQTPVAAGYGFGVTTAQSGLMLVPQCLFSFAAGISAARAAHRLGSRTVIIIGALLAATGTALLALAGGSLVGVYAGTTLIGLGTGLSLALLANLVVAAVPAEQTGVAGGTNANLRTIGGAVGSAVLTTVVTAQVAVTGRPAESGYTDGFLIIAGTLVFAALVGLLVPAGTGRARTAVTTEQVKEHHVLREPRPGLLLLGHIGRATFLDGMDGYPATMTTTRPLALVTGASSGIGLEIAKQFAERGYDLVINAEDPGIDAAAAELRLAGADTVAVRADLRTADGVDQVRSAVTTTGRPLDAAALNAGVGQGKAFLDQDFAQVQEIIDLNVTSTLRLGQAVLRDMVARNAGRVLITSSIASTMPGSYQAAYNASKSFLQSFAEAVQEELEDTEVTITSLMPGPTDTHFFRRADMEDTKVGSPSSSQDDPAEVAKQGVDALLKGERKVLGGSLSSKVQGVVAGVLPDKVKAAMHRSMAEPGSGE